MSLTVIPQNTKQPRTRILGPKLDVLFEQHLVGHTNTVISTARERN